MAEVSVLGGCRTNCRCFLAEMVTEGSRDRTGRDLQPADPAWPPLASGWSSDGQVTDLPQALLPEL
uniref:Alternative protein DCUN1D2 n=1 Tax=Homo sapiens TaxID=9606 RepID=L8E9L0_HUMAN|nr:alternative protein DCUN1D2 [Homo sapiens]